MKFLHATDLHFSGEAGVCVYNIDNREKTGTNSFIEDDASASEKEKALSSVKNELTSLKKSVNESNEIHKISELPLSVQLRVLLKLSKHENILDDDLEDDEMLTGARLVRRGGYVDTVLNFFDKETHGDLSGNKEIEGIINELSGKAIMKFVTSHKEAALELFTDEQKEGKGMEYEIKLYNNPTLKKELNFFDLLPKEDKILMTDRMDNTYSIRTPEGYKSFYKASFSINNYEDTGLKIGTKPKIEDGLSIRIYRSMDDIDNNGKIKEGYDKSGLDAEASYKKENWQLEKNAQVNRQFVLNYKSLLHNFREEVAKIDPKLKDLLSSDILELKSKVDSLSFSDINENPVDFAEWFIDEIENLVNSIVSKSVDSKGFDNVKGFMDKFMHGNYEEIQESEKLMLKVNRESIINILGIEGLEGAFVDTLLDKFTGNEYFTQKEFITSLKETLKELGLHSQGELEEKQLKTVYDLLKSRVRLKVQTSLYKDLSVVTNRALNSKKIEIFSKSSEYKDNKEVQALFSAISDSNNFSKKDLKESIEKIKSLDTKGKIKLFNELKEILPDLQTNRLEKSHKTLSKNVKTMSFFHEMDRVIQRQQQEEGGENFFKEMAKEIHEYRVIEAKKEAQKIYEASHSQININSNESQLAINNAAEISASMPAFTISRFNESGLPIFEIGQSAQEVVVDKEKNEMYPANIDETGTMSDFVKFPINVTNIPGIQITSSVTDGNFWTTDYGVTNANRNMGVSKMQNIFRQIYPLGEVISLNEDVINGWKNLQIELRARGRGMPYFWERMGVVDVHGEILDEKGGDIAPRVRKAIDSARVGNFDWLDGKDQVDDGLYQGVLAKDYGFNDRLIARFGTYLKNSKISIVDFMKQKGLYDKNHKMLDPKFKKDRVWIQKWKVAILGL